MRSLQVREHNIKINRIFERQYIARQTTIVICLFKIVRIGLLKLFFYHDENSCD